MEYIEHIISKYEFNQFSKFDLYFTIKNPNDDVMEYFIHKTKTISSDDIMDICIISNIPFTKLKILFNELQCDLKSDDYFMLLRCFAKNNNLESFKFIEIISKNICDLTQKFIAKEYPLASFTYFWDDYSVNFECDLLLYASDSNSFDIVKYLLSLMIFSKDSIKRSIEYVKNNLYIIRLSESKTIDDKTPTLKLLEECMNI